MALWCAVAECHLTAVIVATGPGLADLPEPVLHHVISLLEPRDLLRLRAVNRGLAQAVRALPDGIFAKLSICLPSGAPEGQQCVARQSPSHPCCSLAEAVSCSAKSRAGRDGLQSE